MSRMACANCNYVMSNTSDDNRIEHFLIETWIENLESRKYKKILLKEIKEQEERNEEFHESEIIDPWFDICEELGRDVWICPECETMHIFSKKHPNRLEKVYKLLDKLEWGKD